jgi:hypothetical protein
MPPPLHGLVYDVVVEDEKQTPDFALRLQDHVVFLEANTFLPPQDT